MCKSQQSLQAAFIGIRRSQQDKSEKQQNNDKGKEDSQEILVCTNSSTVDISTITAISGSRPSYWKSIRRDDPRQHPDSQTL